MRFLRSIVDAILDRSPEELIGALLIASAVAIVMAGLYVLGRRKALCSPTFVGLLALAAGVSCMALAAGYIEYATRYRNSGLAATSPVFPGWPFSGPGRNVPPRPWGFYGAGWSSGFHVVVAADEDRDGRLTSEEVVRLVRKADSDGDGSVDFRDIDREIVRRFRPPFQPPASSDPEGIERRVGDGSSHDQGDAGEGHTRDEKASPGLDEPVAPGPGLSQGR